MILGSQRRSIFFNHSWPPVRVYKIVMPGGKIKDIEATVKKKCFNGETIYNKHRKRCLPFSRCRRFSDKPPLPCCWPIG